MGLGQAGSQELGQRGKPDGLAFPGGASVQLSSEKAELPPASGRPGALGGRGRGPRHEPHPRPGPPALGGQPQAHRPGRGPAWARLEQQGPGPELADAGATPGPRFRFARPASLRAGGTAQASRGWGALGADGGAVPGPGGSSGSSQPLPEAWAGARPGQTCWLTPRPENMPSWPGSQAALQGVWEGSPAPATGTRLAGGAALPARGLLAGPMPPPPGPVAGQQRAPQLPAWELRRAQGQGPRLHGSRPALPLRAGDRGEWLGPLSLTSRGHHMDVARSQGRGEPARGVGSPESALASPPRAGGGAPGPLT